jgi:hypothetical protein
MEESGRQPLSDPALGRSDKHAYLPNSGDRYFAGANSVDLQTIEHLRAIWIAILPGGIPCLRKLRHSGCPLVSTKPVKRSPELGEPEIPFNLCIRCLLASSMAEAPSWLRTAGAPVSYHQGGLPGVHIVSCA